MLVPDAIVLASARWLRLLQTSSIEQASALVRSQAEFADLSVTQYAQALDLLMELGLVVDGSAGRTLAHYLRGASEPDLRLLLLAAMLDAEQPPWLADADALVNTPADLPEDVADLATALGLTDQDALTTIGAAHERIDLAERAAVGLAGELRIVELLESRWHGCTRHVAAERDGLGYDIALETSGTTWHLEVKSTERRGRLVLHVSRREHEVGLQDPAWRLVAVGLGQDRRLGCIATVDYSRLTTRAPHDHHAAASWESVRFDVTPDLLVEGLPFLERTGLPVGIFASAADEVAPGPGAFAWMPR